MQAAASSMKAANKYLSQASKYTGGAKSGATTGHSRYIDSSDEEEDEADGRTGVDRWKKRVTPATGTTKTDEAAVKKVKKDKVERHVGIVAEEDEDIEEDEEALSHAKLEATWGSIDDASLLERLGAVMAMRGKRSISRPSQLAYLRLLLEHTRTKQDVARECRVAAGLMTLLFDAILLASTNVHLSTLATWREIKALLERLVELLRHTPFERFQLTDKDRLSVKEDLAVPIDEYLKQLLLTNIHKLDEEWFKALQTLSEIGGVATSQEYLDRLAEERAILRLAEDFKTLFVPHDASVEKYVNIRLLDHLYDKNVAMLKVLGYSLTDLKTMAATIVATSSVLLSSRFRALMYLVYMEAHSLDYGKAKETLKSHVDVFSHLGVASAAEQILYNRTIIRLAMAAFVTGFVQDCYSLLHEFYSIPSCGNNASLLLAKQRELLGQQSTSNAVVSANEAFFDADDLKSGHGLAQQQAVASMTGNLRIHYPWHMHFSTESLEVLYLISCMATLSPSSLFSCKYFRKFIDFYQKSLLWHGTPETTKDHLFQAFLPFVSLIEASSSSTASALRGNATTTGVSKGAVAVMKLDWRASVELLLKMKVWKWLPYGTDLLATNIALYMKRKALVYYLTFYGKYMKSLSLSYLSREFEMSVDDIVASLDLLKSDDFKSVTQLSEQPNGEKVLLFKQISGSDFSVLQVKEILTQMQWQVNNLAYKRDSVENQFEHLSLQEKGGGASLTGRQLPPPMPHWRKNRTHNVPHPSSSSSSYLSSSSNQNPTPSPSFALKLKI